MPQGLVFDIQRFSIHDGPGIRTTVFLKGCPLHCAWCHNPEGQSAKPEIFFSPEKCIACRYCEVVCPQEAHIFNEEGHQYLRSACIACGECTQECYAQALEVSGRVMTVAEVLTEVLKDRPFYETSGGGMTLSGGEPMQQFEFALALLQAARTENLHTCIETSGVSTTERYLEIRPYVDLFYFDIKESDLERHKQYTGVSNQVIRDNLVALDRAGATIILRCPIIPGLNDRPDHFAAIGQIASQLNNAAAVHILPYHALGTNKNERLGKANLIGDVQMPQGDQIQDWIKAVQAHTSIEVQRG
jgi:pyruvate formate lyase activating enzyme